LNLWISLGGEGGGLRKIQPFEKATEIAADGGNAALTSSPASLTRQYGTHAVVDDR
jgi:hypothetical protein